MPTFLVTCTHCLHQRSFPTRTQADADASAHATANPTHSPKVTEERDERSH